jgi:transcriptional regulator NrdR family protein
MNTAGPDPPGIRCARCHCPDLRVDKTVRLPIGRVRRYRVCRHCGHRQTTLEMHVAEVNKPPSSH